MNIRSEVVEAVNWFPFWRLPVNDPNIDPWVRWVTPCRRAFNLYVLFRTAKRVTPY